MSYAARPDLGFDPASWRSIVKFALIVGVLIGAQIAAERFGFEPWLNAAIQLVWAAVGVRCLWVGTRALQTGEELPEDPAGPRYSKRDVRFIPPRLTATGAVLIGALLVVGSAFRIIQILSE